MSTTEEEEELDSHIHNVCTCGVCGQAFDVCGTPCFVFCLRCRALLIIKYGEE